MRLPFWRPGAVGVQSPPQMRIEVVGDPTDPGAQSSALRLVEQAENGIIQFFNAQRQLCALGGATNWRKLKRLNPHLAVEFLLTAGFEVLTAYVSPPYAPPVPPPGGATAFPPPLQVFLLDMFMSSIENIYVPFTFGDVTHGPYWRVNAYSWDQRGKNATQNSINGQYYTEAQQFDIWASWATTIPAQIQALGAATYAADAAADRANGGALGGWYGPTIFLSGLTDVATWPAVFLKDYAQYAPTNSGSEIADTPGCPWSSSLNVGLQIQTDVYPEGGAGIWATPNWGTEVGQGTVLWDEPLDFNGYIYTIPNGQEFAGISYKAFAVRPVVAVAFPVMPGWYVPVNGTLMTVQLCCLRSDLVK